MAPTVATFHFWVWEAETRYAPFSLSIFTSLSLGLSSSFPGGDSYGTRSTGWEKLVRETEKAAFSESIDTLLVHHSVSFPFFGWLLIFLPLGGTCVTSCLFFCCVLSLGATTVRVVL